MIMVLLLSFPSVTSETSKKEPLIAIYITTLDSRPDQPLGTKLAVGLCNTGSTRVFIRRQLDAIEPWPWNPLQAKVVDLQSGKPVGTRVIVKRAERPLREDDFVELRPHYCYGVVVDLAKHFVLESRRSYSVQFSYSSNAPKKVGKLLPWSGMAQSTKVVIRTH